VAARHGASGRSFSKLLNESEIFSEARPLPLSTIIQIPVELGARSYPVLIGAGMLGSLGGVLREQGLSQTEAFVITNREVGAHYFGPVEASLKDAGFGRIVRHDIPATEEGKNWDEFSKACAALLEAFPDAIATPLVLLLGGGVIGDLGGFAAAVFRRGVAFVQIPTTLLAAVDSSVGGKVAVNFAGVKNIMGAFSQPRLVVCDLETLATLPARELRSGMAEVIKYGAVCSAGLFEQLERGDLEKTLALDPPALAEVVAQCVRLKAAVVERDEFDKKGIRNVLNFGHTIGHALELSADYALTHGEAIAIGMVAATRLARALAMVGAEFEERLQGLIIRAGLPTAFTKREGLFERILRAMRMDKKFRDGKNVFVLPTGIGAWEQRADVDWALVHEAVRSILA
jgi:3-dehydroquinate synthase